MMLYTCQLAELEGEWPPTPKCNNQFLPHIYQHPQQKYPCFSKAWHAGTKKTKGFLHAALCVFFLFLLGLELGLFTLVLYACASWHYTCMFT